MINIKEIKFKIIKKIFYTNLFIIFKQKVIIFPIKKLYLIFKYKPIFSFPNIIFEYNKEIKGVVLKIQFFYSIGFLYETKNKPKINPIIYEIILKILINLFLIYKLVYYIKQ